MTPISLVYFVLGLSHTQCSESIVLTFIPKFCLKFYSKNLIKMSLVEQLGKRYKLSESDKFDEYMKALGVGLVTRKMGNAVSPVVDLLKEGDEYVLSSSSTFKNVVIRFKPGVEFEQETPDGRKVKSTITIDGTTLHEVQKDPAGKEIVIDRTFSNDEIKMVMSVDNITATRIYKPLA